MIARVAQVEGTPEQIAKMGRMLSEGTVPELKNRYGFRGFLWLTDARRGRALLINLWDSREAHVASERLWRQDEATPVSDDVGVHRRLLGGFDVEISEGLA